MECGWDKGCSKIGKVQTNTGGKTTSQTETPVPPLAGQVSFVLRKVISFSYDGFFSVFFYACASQFYDAFSSYHKAYSNNF
jgi:hypothetical protein